MKVVALNGSPKKNGNTSIALGIVCEELKKEGIETEILQVGGKIFNPCKVCLVCRKEKDGFCHGYKNDSNDVLNQYLEKIYEAQGLIIGSPVYFGSLTPETKAFIDRAGYCSRGGGGNLIRRKVCAPLAVVRRQGAGATIEQINNFFALGEAVVTYSSYWNMAIGKDTGDILNDTEGVDTLKKLGINMAWLLKKINA
ncbi:MAG: flavodoxin family protein [Actinobacteria bacterium]|nr:flavodoxin family protein [Actinomycetota bacterium]